MMIRHLIVLAVALQTCWLLGCGGGGPKPGEAVPTFPVTGVVKIDGTPTPMVRVLLFPIDKIPEWFDHRVAAPHWAQTDPEGNFKITTYNAADGAPAGEYAVYFYWEGTPKMVPLSDPDEVAVDPVAAKFNAKYANLMKPQLPTVKVEDGKPTDMGTLELTTK
jgi:hypothetical protein